MVGEHGPHVGDGQHPCDYCSEGGLPVVDLTPSPGPAIAGLPPDELPRRSTRQHPKAMLVPHRFPQQRRSIGHDKPRCLHGIFRTEVSPVPHLTSQVDDECKRFLRRAWVLGPQRRLSVGSQPPECYPPASPLVRRHPPVTGDVRARPGQLCELSDLVQHQARVGWLRRSSLYVRAAAPNPSSTGSTAPSAARPRPAMTAWRRTLPGSSAWQACQQMLGPSRQPGVPEDPRRTGTTHMPAADGLELPFPGRPGRRILPARVSAQHLDTEGTLTGAAKFNHCSTVPTPVNS